MAHSTSTANLVTKNLASWLATPLSVGTVADALQDHTTGSGESAPTVVADYIGQHTSETQDTVEDAVIACYAALSGSSQCGQLDVARSVAIGTTLAVIGASTLTGEATLGANLILDSANPTVTIGDNSGGGFADFAGTAADQGVRLYAGGVVRSRIVQNATDLYFSAHDAAGVLQFNTKMQNSTGSWFFPASLHLAGAASGDANADYDDFVVGNGVGNRGLGIFSSATGESRIEFFDTAGVAGSNLRYLHDPSEQKFVFNVEGSDRLNITNTELRPNSNGLINLGSAAVRWADGFINTIHVAGAASGDAHADVDDLVIGDGSANAGLSVVVDDGGTSTGRIGFTLDSAASFRAGMLYGTSGGERMQWYLANASKLTLSSGNILSSTTDGQIALGASASSGWSSLVLSERSDSVGTATPTRAELWLDDATMQGVRVTDDRGLKAYLNNPIQEITDDSASPSAKTIRIGSPSVAADLALATAIGGEEYWVDVWNVDNGVTITSAASDAINGGATGSSAAISTVGLYHLYALDDADWYLHGPIALGPASA